MYFLFNNGAQSEHGADAPEHPEELQERDASIARFVEFGNKAVKLVPPLEVTIERGLEIMAEDEYLEITPRSVRLRKRYLTESERSKHGRSG